MTATVHELYRAVMALPAADQADLLSVLHCELGHLIDGDPEALPASYPLWKDELARRSAAMDAGTARLVAWEEVRAKALKRVGLSDV